MWLGGVCTTSCRCRYNHPKIPRVLFGLRCNLEGGDLRGEFADRSHALEAARGRELRAHLLELLLDLLLEGGALLPALGFRELLGFGGELADALRLEGPDRRQLGFARVGVGAPCLRDAFGVGARCDALPRAPLLGAARPVAVWLRAQPGWLLAVGLAGGPALHRSAGPLRW